MNRLLCLIFVLCVLFSGCGEEEEKAGPEPLKVLSVSIADGSIVAGTIAITVSFNNEVEEVEISITGSQGSVKRNGKFAVWTAIGEMPPGDHDLTVTAVDVFGQELGHFEPISFTAEEA